jgi:osmotically-inducible protein OsmY/sporulation protein YlmC with PRC-barrel domain
MTERVELRLGMMVVCRDGDVGRVDRLVVRPGSGEVTGLVVRKGLLLKKDVVVPVEAIEEASEDYIRIRLSSEELDALPPYREEAYTAAPAEWRTAGGQEIPGAIFALPEASVQQGLEATTSGQTTEGTGSHVLRAGQTVTGRDGDLGRLSLVLLDPSTRRATHFVIRRGTLRRDIIVPVDWIRAVSGDRVLLDVTRDQVEHLPEYRSDDEITADVLDTLWYGSGIDPGELCCVDISTRDGIVEIRGTTITEEGRLAIEHVAASVRGVLGVRNRARSMESLAAEAVGRAPAAAEAEAAEMAPATPAEEREKRLAAEVLQAVAGTVPQVEAASVQVHGNTAIVRGTVEHAADRRTIAERARAIPGIRAVYSLAGVREETPQQAREPISAAGYGYPWIHDLIQRATGLDVTLQQATSLTRLAERKLIDLFDVAAETAAANGRQRILLHDLPLTKGLRRRMEEAAALAHEVELEPVLVFLYAAGSPEILDENLRGDLPKLMTALLLLGAQMVALLEPAVIPPKERLELLMRTEHARPTPWEIERATQAIDLVL